jgi:chemotaxis protein methyltransferase CheR
MMEINNHITDLLIQLLQIDISRYEESFLDKCIQNSIEENRCSSVGELCKLLEQSNSKRQAFIETLQNSYSELFRNPLTFDVLERIVLPSLIFKKKENKRKEIRIWSAACAGGEEVYSLAILMEELNTGKNQIKFRIFATDRNAARISEAEKGQYTVTALNNLSFLRAKMWLNKQGDVFTVRPELKANIDFSVFDLADRQLASPPASIFGDFDLIICANLLFYYKEEFRKIIIGKLTNCLADGGYLVTGETEREILIKYNYHEVFPQSAIFQKNECL